MKGLIVDGKYAICGSANFTRNSREQCYEFAVMTSAENVIRELENAMIEGYSNKMAFIQNRIDLDHARSLEHGHGRQVGAVNYDWHVCAIVPELVQVNNE